jgi:hypothetical protein
MKLVCGIVILPRSREVNHESRRSSLLQRPRARGEDRRWGREG